MQNTDGRAHAYVQINKKAEILTILHRYVQSGTVQANIKYVLINLISSNCSQT